MSGIAGVFGRQDPQLLDRMLDRIRHRGPDGQGVLHGEGFSLGHNLLQLPGLAPEHQPVKAAAEQVVLVFSGELHAPGAGHCPAAYVLDRYLQQGLRAVEELDGAFAVVIFDARGDSGRVLMARDHLGLAPLYYGYDAQGHLCFASEIKGLLVATDDVREFPPGHRYVDGEGLAAFWELPEGSMDLSDVTAATDQLQSILEQAVAERMAGLDQVGIFLSGGLDSSLIAAIAAKIAREQGGPELTSFAVGVEGAEDLVFAQVVADALGLRHHALAHSPADVVAVVPRAIEAMESFDPPLVRGSTATFMAGSLAAEHGMKVVLCGEGSDELFAGYHYLKEFAGDPEALHNELRELTSELHNTGIQRVDRLTMAHSLSGRAPFLDLALLESAFNVHPGLKQYGDELIEKWIVRKVAERYLPHDVVWRTKQKFATGTGVGNVLEEAAEAEVDDAEFQQQRRLPGGWVLNSKEELHYYRLWREFFGHNDALIEEMGRSRSIGEQQRYTAATR